MYYNMQLYECVMKGRPPSVLCILRELESSTLDCRHQLLAKTSQQNLGFYSECVGPSCDVLASVLMFVVSTGADRAVETINRLVGL